MTAERESALNRVLQEAGFAGAARSPMPGDASTRRYERLESGGRRAILMDAPPTAEQAPCPPQATPQERLALGYNAAARLAAGRVDAFVTVAAELEALGLSAPRIYAFDADFGFAVLEDFGEGLYFDLLPKLADVRPQYEAAIDALAALSRHPAPPTLTLGAARWPLLAFDRTARLAEADLMLDWFAGRRHGVTLPPDVRAEWEAAWDAAFSALDGAGQVLMLRDFHSPNLMWLPERHGARRAGLLDFQDALAGHPAYDVASLLEDVRRDVPADFAEAMLERYLDRAEVADRDAFRAAFFVMAAQRNCKVAGIFVRLHMRDGKDKYLQHLPRVLRYLARDFEHPALAPVAAWFARHLPIERWADPKAAA